jgi:hypothetical protein
MLIHLFLLELDVLLDLLGLFLAFLDVLGV